eukprot:5582046-Pleurochrysis_carterae.AAC.1
MAIAALKPVSCARRREDAVVGCTHQPQKGAIGHGQRQVNSAVGLTAMRVNSASRWAERREVGSTAPP